MQASTTTGTLLLCIVVSGLSLSANAQAPACDSGCLKGFVDVRVFLAPTGKHVAAHPQSAGDFIPGAGGM